MASLVVGAPGAVFEVIAKSNPAGVLVAVLVCTASPKHWRPVCTTATSLPSKGSVVTSDAALPRTGRVTVTRSAVSAKPKRSPKTALGASPTVAGVSLVATHVPDKEVVCPA